jgi:predicted dinucleotide-binding enzyme
MPSRSRLGEEEEGTMRIAIIGSGNVGKALATSAVRAGHAVTIASADPEGATAAARAEGADAVILAVPSDALAAVVGELGATLDGVVVIDVTNRVNPQDPGSVLDGSSNAERVQAQVPGARVVKAFNTAFAARQADPVVDGVQLDGFVAGDDPAAKAAVLDLVRSMGFRPIDAGPLAMARVLEGMGLLNISLQIRNNWPWQSGWKLVGPTGQ